MRHFLSLLLLCQLLLTPFITQAQSYSESDKEGLRLWLRQMSAESGIPNFQSLGLAASDTIDWNTTEQWLEKLQEPSALSYIDWEWDMGIPANLIRLEIKTFDDSNKSAIAGDINCSYFFYLQEFDCSNTSIKSIDLSASIKLRKLSCSNTYLTNLNTNACSILTSLDCSDNQISSLNLMQNLGLEYLDCSGNNLKELSVIDNIGIHTLSCAKNQLNRLDLPRSPALEALDCSDNRLVSLNLSKYPTLKFLSIGNNQLSNIDLSNNPALLSLHMRDNGLNEINLSANNAVRILDVANNSLNILDLNPHRELEYLLCPNNELDALNISANTNLKELNCAFNNLYDLAYSKTANSGLYSFKGNDNQMRFSTLPTAFIGSSMAESIYAPQADWDGGEILFNNPIDLSSEFEFQGEKTSYTWAYGLDVSLAIMPNNNGVFYATINDDYFSFCKLTNPIFPDLELNYKVKILKDTLVGITTGKGDTDVTIYYDKASQLLKIESFENILSVDLYDTIGRCLLSAHDLGSDASIPVMNAHPGVYIARVMTETRKAVTQKISIY